MSVRKDLRSVFAVLTGTGGAQLIALLFTPFLTRIFPPEAFGHLGVFLALAAILIPIAALTLPMAIVLTKTNDEAISVSNLAFQIALLGTGVFLAFIFLSFDFLLDTLHATDGGFYLYLVPLVVFFSALLQLTENWTIKLSFFKLKAKVSLVHALVINTLKLLLGLWLPTAATLIFIAIMNPLLNAALLFSQLKNHIFSEKKISCKLDENWRKLFSKYRDFPLFQAPQALLNALSQSSPVILIAAFFGPVSAGFYAFSRTILALPIVLIGKAIGDVFYGRIAKEINEQRFQSVIKLFIQSTLLLAGLGCFPLLVILLWGPDIFSLVFGDKWYQAGVYAQWLSLWTFFILINAPSLKLIIALKQQPKALLINLISTPIRIAVLCYGGYVLKNEWLAVQLFVAVSIAHNLAIIGLAYFTCRKKVLLEKVTA